MFTSGKAANFIGDMIFLFMVLSFIYVFISIKRYHFSKKHPWKNVFAWVSYCLLVAGLLFTFIEYNKTQRNPIGTSSLFLETYADNAILHPKVYEAITGTSHSDRGQTRALPPLPVQSPGGIAKTLRSLPHFLQAQRCRWNTQAVRRGVPAERRNGGSPPAVWRTSAPFPRSNL